MTKTEILNYNYTKGGRNYILLGNQKWIAFTRQIIEKKLIPKFGTDFNLIVYWYENLETENINFICVPYSEVSHLLTEDHLTGKNTNRARWNFIIKDNLFCVHANTQFSIDIALYLNKLITYNNNQQKYNPSSFENFSVEEGKEKYLKHKSIERNSNIINKVKSKRKLVDPKLHCEICGFSFVEKYGSVGDGFIEAHHIIPLSQIEESTITREEDLILVCSNCHRMLHRPNTELNPQALKEKIR